MAQTHVLTSVEERTQELGRALYSHAQRYRPPLLERLQDWLMVRLMEEPRLRNQLLRFVDVLAALDYDRRGRQVKRLVQEYFGEPIPGLPWPLRLLLSWTCSSSLPSPLVAWGTRAATRSIASRFIAPAGSLGVRQALDYLQAHGRLASFAILGELVVSEEEADRSKDGYLDLLSELERHPAAGKRTVGDMPQLQVSIKLSSLTADFNPIDPEGTLSRVRPALEEICRRAREAGVGVAIDMEHFEYRDLIWHIFTQTFGPGRPFGLWGDIGIVAQAYLRDAEANLARILHFAGERGTPFQVRLVKGAYWDYETIVAQQMGWPVPVYQRKPETDLSYQRLLRLLLENAERIKLAVASHNLRSHAYAEAVREQLGLPSTTIEHQTLFRTAEHTSRALAALGWLDRDYVPVGELIPGMAYLVRRILENTSQVGFLMQNRLGRDPRELLADPALVEAEEHAEGAAEALERERFRNHPPKRLFDVAERAEFQRALDRVRAQWGREYPLKLGDETVSTRAVAPSLSPSHPHPERPVGWVHGAGTEETERAVTLANAAFPKWAAQPIAHRAAIARKAAALMAQERDDLAAWVVDEGGKNWPNALADVDEAIDHLRFNALQLERLAARVQRDFRPRGVVGVVPPWNFPLAIPCGMASAALLAGNAVILKSAEATPVVAHLLVDVLHRAGVPRDILIHLPGPGPVTGAALVQSADVDMVAFTGSKATGLWIHQAASRVALRKGGFKKVLAEMGGKNAIVVFPDADQDEAVQGILRSAFGHANQKCSACSRVFIHRDIYQSLRHRLIQGARSLVVGPADHPGTFLNPLISEEARRKVLGYAERARAEGTILLDEMRQGEPGSYCLGPMLVELQPDQVGSILAQEEIFGPILTVTPFDDEAEVVSMINRTSFALTAGIFSRSPRTVARMVQAARAGNLYLNRDITGARVGIEPFGGFQLSGTGPKAGSEEYLLAFLTRKGEWRRASMEATRSPRRGEAPHEAVRIVPWSDASVHLRAARLRLALARLEAEERPNLEQAAMEAFGLSSEEAQRVAGQTLSLLAQLLDQAPELAEPQPTVTLPGQKNFLLWTAPRGVGLAITDQGASLECLAGMVWGPLLAGNGLVLVPHTKQWAIAQLLVGVLHGAGVPPEVLAMSRVEGQEGVLALAAERFHFAATDMSLEGTRALATALGPTDEAGGQTWLKALISMNDGPRLGDPGFLRLFTTPKTVAVRTLRHGADLDVS